MNKFRVVIIVISAMICTIWIFSTNSKAFIDFNDQALWEIDKHRVYDFWYLMIPIPPPPRQLPQTKKHFDSEKPTHTAH